MSEKTLVVLAAGMGSRYGGLKQMDPVGPNGETILEYSVFDATRAGFGKAVFVIRREFESEFRAMVAGWFHGRVEGQVLDRIAVEYAFQDIADLPEGFSVPAGRTKPWGTTQAVLAAEKVVSTPFAVINADDFYGAESYEVLARHLEAQVHAGTGEYAMVGFCLRETLTDSGAVARGLCRVGEDGLLEDIVELTSVERCGAAAKSTDRAGKVTMLSGDETVSMNMWGFTTEVFGQLRAQFVRFLETNGGDLKAECYLPNTVNELIRAQPEQGGAWAEPMDREQNPARVRVLKTSAHWFGVTYREDRAQVVEEIGRLVKSGAYPARLWA
jgi:hypothetical protein